LAAIQKNHVFFTSNGNSILSKNHIFFPGKRVDEVTPKLQAMKRVTLQFPDLFLLWSFAKTLQSNNLEINSGFKTLVCNCSGENILQATTKYKAKVIHIEP